MKGDSPRDTARQISVSLDDLGFLCHPYHYFTQAKEWLPHLQVSQCIFLHGLKSIHLDFKCTPVGRGEYVPFASCECERV